MATVYGVNRTLKNTGSVNTIAPELVGAKVKWVYGEYTLAALASGSVIELFGINLPLGARIVDWIIDHANLGNNTTLALGTKASGASAVLMAAVDCGAGAAAKKTMQVNGVASALGYTIVAGTVALPGTVLMLTTGAGEGSGIVKVGVAYVSKG